MHKINKVNKSGFTLVEMLLVIAIILILASVLALSVSSYMNRAHDASDAVGEQVTNMKTDNSSRIGQLKTYGF